MKNVIITGTSRGIGFELAQLFAKNNCNVLALSRNSEPLESLKIQNITALSVDLSKENDLKKVAEFISENWKKVDISINNAGKLISKPFDKLTAKDFLEVYSVNVFAVAELTQQILPFLKKGFLMAPVSYFALSKFLACKLL